MDFDFARLPAPDRYKLLAGSVTPRPIAWITSQSAEGARNAAPFSFFNVMSAEPPLVAVGMMRRPDGTFKDTSANLLETGEFVVHLVCESDAAAMNLTCIDAPPGVDEIALAGLEVGPSVAVAPPRILSAPVAMECRVWQTIDTGASLIVLGQVLHFHIADAFVDAARLHVDAAAMGLVGRAGGAGGYVRSTDRFQMQRPVWGKDKQG